MELNWTTEWPTEIGLYWFYGVRYKDSEDQTPKWYAVKVEKYFILCEGKFMYQCETGIGMFAKIDETKLKETLPVQFEIKVGDKFLVKSRVFYAGTYAFKKDDELEVLTIDSLLKTATISGPFSSPVPAVRLEEIQIHCQKL